MIIIGYNYDGYVISIVNAKSEEFAYTYWQGQGTPIHSHVVLDVNAINDHLTGVIPILRTEEKEYTSAYTGDKKKGIFVCKSTY